MFRKENTETLYFLEEYRFENMDSLTIWLKILITETLN